MYCTVLLSKATLYLSLNNILPYPLFIQHTTAQRPTSTSSVTFASRGHTLTSAPNTKPEGGTEREERQQPKLEGDPRQTATRQSQRKGWSFALGWSGSPPDRLSQGGIRASHPARVRERERRKSGASSRSPACSASSSPSPSCLCVALRLCAPGRSRFPPQPVLSGSVFLPGRSWRLALRPLPCRPRPSCALLL
jgi:hypothetical protein